MDLAIAKREAVSALRRYYDVTHVAHGESKVNLTVSVPILKHRSLQDVDLYVTLTAEFPLALPNIRVARPLVEQFGFPMNVDTRGVVCTYDPTTTVPDPAKPGELVVTCVRRAIHILEADPESAEEYLDELLAYWDARYPPEPPVDDRIMSLIPEDSEAIESVQCARFRFPLGPFQSVLFVDRESFEPLRQTLLAKQITFSVESTFHIGHLNVGRPPYSMQNFQVVKLVSERGLKSEYFRFISQQSEPLITFDVPTGGRRLVLGWRHQRTKAAKSGKHHKRASKRQLKREHLVGGDRLKYVERISPQNVTSPRLTHRTSANVPECGSLTLGFIGLGSVGSGLVGLLASCEWTGMRLVDPDVMATENLKRHLLGLDAIGKPKVVGIQSYLVNKNPLGDVRIRAQSVVEVIEAEPDFLGGCDFVFVCTGSPNVEAWLAGLQSEGTLTKPMVYIWVEPHLAGGHCLVLGDSCKVGLPALFDGYVYVHNVITREAHAERTFVKREAGCQTSFIPFGGEALLSFLSRLTPELLRVMRQRDSNCKRFTYVGDLTELDRLEIPVTDAARAAGAFSFLSENFA